MPYSGPEDLLTGDTLLGVSPEKFVQEAAEEIDGKLGFVYQLPLKPADPQADPQTWEGLPEHEQLLLRQVNNKLASGSLIMATTSSEEQQAVHAYGLLLVREARADLMALANQDVMLSALRVATEQKDRRRLPEIKNHDEESLLLGFENTVMKGKPWYSRPGAING